MTWKQVLLVVAGIGFFSLLGAVAYGYTLPTDWHVDRSITVSAAPADFHALVDTPAGWQEWLTPPASGLHTEAFGPATGVGAGHSWQGAGTYGRMEITRDDPASGIDYAMTMEESATPAKGTFVYRRQLGDTQITWTDEGDFGEMPLGGYLVHAMESSLGEHMESSLLLLKARAEVRAAARAEQRAAEENAASIAATAAPDSALQNLHPSENEPGGATHPPPDANAAAKLVPAMHP